MPREEKRGACPARARAREDSTLMDGSRRVNGSRREFRAIHRRVRHSIRRRGRGGRKLPFLVSLSLSFACPKINERMTKSADSLINRQADRRDAYRFCHGGSYVTCARCVLVIFVHAEPRHQPVLVTTQCGKPANRGGREGEGGKRGETISGWSGECLLSLARGS